MASAGASKSSGGGDAVFSIKTWRVDPKDPNFATNVSSVETTNDICKQVDEVHGIPQTHQLIKLHGAVTFLNIDGNGVTNPPDGVKVSLKRGDIVEVLPNRQGGAGARSCTQQQAFPGCNFLGVVGASTNKAGQVGHNSVKICFEPTSNLPGVTWELEVKDHSGLQWAAPPSVTRTEGFHLYYFVVRALKPETLYSFRVRSSSGNGAGSWETIGPIKTKKAPAQLSHAAGTAAAAAAAASTPARAPAPATATAASPSSPKGGAGLPTKTPGAKKTKAGSAAGVRAQGAVPADAPAAAEDGAAPPKKKKQRTTPAAAASGGGGGEVVVLETSDDDDESDGQAPAVAAAAAAGGGASAAAAAAAAGGACAAGDADMCVVCFDKAVNVVVRVLRLCHALAQCSPHPILPLCSLLPLAVRAVRARLDVRRLHPEAGTAGAGLPELPPGCHRFDPGSRGHIRPEEQCVHAQAGRLHAPPRHNDQALHVLRQLL